MTVLALLASTDPPSSDNTGSGASYFVLQWIVLLGGAAIHWLIDRRRHGHQAGRGVELVLLWLLVFGGGWAIFGGIGHISGMSGEVAEQIGFAQSMFQWEVGWGDIALGVIGLGCAWRVLRGHWMTAAVVVLAIQYMGDGIGHIMEWVAHDNTAPNNVWAIPNDFIQPLLALVLLLAYRRAHPVEHVERPPAPARAAGSEPTAARAPAGPATADR